VQRGCSCNSFVIGSYSRGFALIGLALPQLASPVTQAKARMAQMSAATSRRLAIASAV
jgi:hypothetical protein